MSAKALTLTAEERISSRILIEKLFDGGNSRSMTAYPVRLVYLQTDRQPGDVAAKILVSAPKRNLRHAVDRNRVKRQMREAYRKNKHLILEKLDANSGMALAFIWLEKQPFRSSEVEQRIINLLERVSEKL
ncbi:MAG: ribonuclease P protein component [Prevotella sp.]|uniref:ribonuclease P protein component n=1 Tax=Prevotella sp. Rep29 TaxID=2691580 RepID=UPI001C6E1F7F|nr:ribonuclease P protein component [Prevotella sp. Rep29]MBQ3624812.1 ribonuclease P protein component [Prevotella sp.]MBR3445861.1 ribonuclease P protein component [Prevotella sp.]QYR09801.1 ribonuclease P protein component [Prevotella sp. Rep29]